MNKDDEDFMANILNNSRPLKTSNTLTVVEKSNIKFSALLYNFLLDNIRTDQIKELLKDKNSEFSRMCYARFRSSNLSEDDKNQLKALHENNELSLILKTDNGIEKLMIYFSLVNQDYNFITENYDSFSGGKKAKPAKNPKDKKLYNKIKREAKKKFDVYPSKYANMWLNKTYKKQGGTFETKK